MRDVSAEDRAQWRASAENARRVLTSERWSTSNPARILALLDALDVTELERAQSEALRMAIEGVVDECAESGCIHLNTMWGKIRAALTAADLVGARMPEPPYWCYPCSRGDHDACKVIAWQPDVDCECAHDA